MQKKSTETEQDRQLANLIAQAGNEARDKRKQSLSAHNDKLKEIVAKAAKRRSTTR